jgi:biotin transport system substrate-specific component
MIASEKKMALKSLILSAFFAVLTGVGGQFSIPLPFSPVPISMQSFIALMSGLLLGPKYGPISQMIYIALGLLGAPVFAGGTGGLHRVLSPSFGFILGFVSASWIAGWLGSKIHLSKEAAWRGFFFYSLVSFAATAALYAVGLPWFHVNMNYVTGTEMSFLRSAQLAFLPFLVPDALKAATAGWLASRTVPALRGAGLLKSEESAA